MRTAIEEIEAPMVHSVTWGNPLLAVTSMCKAWQAGGAPEE